MCSAVDCKVERSFSTTVLKEGYPNLLVVDPGKLCSKVGISCCLSRNWNIDINGCMCKGVKPECLPVSITSISGF